jgi:7,8-dihydroneopterin aldolase/epimerase/oxygenase
MNKSIIGIEGIRIFAHHGYYEEERLIGREFVTDVYVSMNQNKAGDSDQLGDTLNYEQVLNICTEEMAITSKLLEHVCARIGNRIKNLLNAESSVRVRISKEVPLLSVQIDRFYVEMTL